MTNLLLRVLLSAAVAWQTITAGSGCEGAECGNIKVSRRPDQHSEFLNQFNEMNPTADRQHRDPGAVLPFIGLTGSAKQSRSCCKNGGTCILGSFCACPKHFSGRSCEYDERARNCGVIPHGEWVQKGCSYCRCGYGVLHCFPEVFHGDCATSYQRRQTFIRLHQYHDNQRHMECPSRSRNELYQILSGISHEDLFTPHPQTK
ncbi:hypothetical protein MHYP_G00185520 [Metynnis hypsauchen]